MSVNEGPFRAKSSARLPVVGETGLLATIAAAFLIFHILAMILMQATAGVATPPQEAARPSSYD
ncbi:hypothetical protein V1289_005168 [Bradyrhizobium sp. AZCC 2289]